MLKRTSRGLPDHSLLGDQTDFIAAFEACIREATLYLGADKVREIVKKVTKKPRGKQEELNRKILGAYNAEAAKGKVNITKLVERLSEGVDIDADAIKRQLHRLRREQDRRARQSADLLLKVYPYRRGTLLGSDSDI